MARLTYQRPDGTEVRALLIGPFSSRPDAATSLGGVYFYASDTEVLYLHNGSTWIPAIDPAPVPLADVGVLGTVKLHRAKSGTHPVALTADDLGVPGGVLQLDSGGLVARAQVPIADATHLGGIKQGANLSIASDGTASVTSGGAGSFGVQHNGSGVAVRGIVDFEDGSGFTVTTTDDTTNAKVDIVLGATTSLVTMLVSGTPDSAFIDNLGWKSLYHFNLTAGTWVVTACVEMHESANLSPFTNTANMYVDIGGSSGGATAQYQYTVNHRQLIVQTKPFTLTTTTTVRANGKSSSNDTQTIDGANSFLMAIKILD